MKSRTIECTSVQNCLSTYRSSFATGNQVVTLTRVTNEQNVNWVDLLQVTSLHFSSLNVL